MTMHARISIVLALTLTVGLSFAQEGDRSPTKDALEERVPTVDLSEGVPEAWLETGLKPRVRFEKMEGKRAPEIKGMKWENTRELSIEKLEGSTTLLYFWSPDCPSCMEMTDDLNALHELYEEDGLVILGICMTYGESEYDGAIEDKEIAFPVCLDRAGQTSLAYKTDGTPDFYLIDGEGTLRIADLKDEAVIPAVMSLLREADEKASGSE